MIKTKEVRTLTVKINRIYNAEAVLDSELGNKWRLPDVTWIHSFDNKSPTLEEVNAAINFFIELKSEMENED